MKAGFARRCITPPQGTRLQGFLPRDLQAPVAKVHDDVHVRILYLEDEGERLVIVGLDVCFVGRLEAAVIKAALGTEFDLAPRQILLNSSHTHASGALGRWGFAPEERTDEVYLHAVSQRIAQACSEAKRTACEATLRAGCATTGVPCSRRCPDATGAIRNAPNPAAPVFNALPVAVFEDVASTPICVLFSIGSHPSTVNGTEVSADYPGVAMSLLDRHHGRPVALFLQGPGGDARPRPCAQAGQWRRNHWPDVAATGRIVAQETLGHLKHRTRRFRSSLASAITTVHLPLAVSVTSARRLRAQANESYWRGRPPWEARWRAGWAEAALREHDRFGAFGSDTASIVLQRMRLADGVEIVALEGEPVGRLGQIVSDASDAEVAFVLGYSNGEGLYLPTSEMLAEGGYEVESYWEYGYAGPLKPGLEDLIVAGLPRIGDARPRSSTGAIGPSTPRRHRG